MNVILMQSKFLKEKIEGETAKIILIDHFINKDDIENIRIDALSDSEVEYSHEYLSIEKLTAIETESILKSSYLLSEDELNGLDRDVGLVFEYELKRNLVRILKLKYSITEIIRKHHEDNFILFDDNSVLSEYVKNAFDKINVDIVIKKIKKKSNDKISFKKRIIRYSKLIKNKSIDIINNSINITLGFYKSDPQYGVDVSQLGYKLVNDYFFTDRSKIAPISTILSSSRGGSLKIFLRKVIRLKKNKNYLHLNSKDFLYRLSKNIKKEYPDEYVMFSFILLEIEYFLKLGILDYLTEANSFKLSKLKAIFLSNDVSIENRIIILLAKRSKIKTICVQHGYTSYFHDINYKFSDYAWVWGQAEEDVCLSRGCCKSNILRLGPPMRKKIGNDFSIHKNYILICTTGSVCLQSHQHEHWPAFYIRTVFRYIKEKNLQQDLIFRFHHGENHNLVKKMIYIINNKEFGNEFKISFDNSELMTVISKAALVISPPSTLIFDLQKTGSNLVVVADNKITTKSIINQILSLPWVNEIIDLENNKLEKITNEKFNNTIEDKYIKSNNELCIHNL